MGKHTPEVPLWNWDGTLFQNGEPTMDAKELQEKIRKKRALQNAAPKLLDMLYKCIPYVEDALEDPVYKDSAVRKDIAKIKALIAKAEGNA